MKTHSHGSLLSLFAALAVLAPSSFAGDLFVGAGHPFSEIDPAIAAASPGDRIFVSSGIFQPFHLAKAVEVRGSGPILTRILGFTPGDFVTVTGIPAGATATISFMAFDHVDPTVETLNPLIDIFDNAGTVVLQDVQVNLFPMASHKGPGVHAKKTARLLVQGSLLKGSFGSSFGGVGDAALAAEDCSLVVTDCDLFATGFQFGEFVFGEPGAPAAELVRCDARFSRVRATGGSGGTDAFTLLSFPGGAGVDLSDSTLELAGGPGNVLKGGTGASFSTASGGPGLSVVSNSSVRIAADAVFLGGLDGFGVVTAAPLFVDAGSSSTSLAFDLPTLVPGPGHAAVGGSFVLEHSGAPTALVVPLYSFQLGPALPLVGIDGLLHLEATSLFLLPAIPLDGFGLGVTVGMVPALPVLAGAHVWLQAGEIAGGAIRLSNPARLELE